MIDVRAIALTSGDVAFFPLRPDRPQRSTRRTGGSRAGRLLGAIRRELTRAATEAEAGWRPTLRNYPY